jgi:hypothetical protein
MTEPPTSEVLELFRERGDAASPAEAAAAPAAWRMRRPPVRAPEQRAPGVVSPRALGVGEAPPALPYSRAERRDDERQGRKDGQHRRPQLDLGEACTPHMEDLVAHFTERGAAACRQMLLSHGPARVRVAQLEAGRRHARSARELAVRRAEQGEASSTPHVGEGGGIEGRVRARRLVQARAAEQAVLNQAADAAADSERQAETELAGLGVVLADAARDLSAQLDQLAWHTMRRLLAYGRELGAAHSDPRVEAELPRIVEERVAAARTQLEDVMSVQAPVANLEPSPAEQAS